MAPRVAVALLVWGGALFWGGAALVLPAAPRSFRASLRLRGIAPDDLPKSIVPEADAAAARAKAVRDKMKELREFKRQGRRYDGSRDDDAAAAAAAATAAAGGDAGFSQAMDEGEALFGTGERRESPAARARAKVEALREMKRKGLRYDGSAEEANRTTSGIGGSWSPPAVTESHKPKVSTWGVFERPADISKAYGGGKRVGVGAPPPVVNATKEAETRERLRKFRERSQKDERVVDAHWEEIANATALARRRVARGASYEAVRALEPVATWCTPKTRRGGETLLELALAHEAAGDGAAARRIYADLERSPIADIKRRAKQLNFGFEAAETLGVGASARPRPRGGRPPSLFFCDRRLQRYADSEAAKAARAAFEFDLTGARVTTDAVAVGAGATFASSNPALDSRQSIDEALKRAALGRAQWVDADAAVAALRALDGGLPAGAPFS